MRKYFFLLCGVFLLIASVVWAQVSEKYVRKKPEHNFFMPKHALGKPENLPMPRYTKGQKESVKSLKNAEDVPHWTDEEIEAMRQLSKTPEYKKKFDEYQEDIANIDENGEVPENPVLNKDLQEMNSNRKIRVEIKGGDAGKPLF